MKRTHEEIEKFIADELEFGLIEEADVAAERARLAPRHKFKEWTYDELAELEDLQWLAGDEERPLLIKYGFGLTYGLFEGGKTYFSMELAFCVAFGLEFHGLPVAQGNVAYVIAEGGTKRHL